MVQLQVMDSTAGFQQQVLQNDHSPIDSVDGDIDLVLLAILLPMQLSSQGLLIS